MKPAALAPAPVLVLALSLALGLPPGSVFPQELPRCPKSACGWAVTSSWWKFCPACGTALPEFTLQGPLADGEQVLGNVYVHGRLGLRIDAPDDRWQILKGATARTVHPQASVSMARPPSLNAVVFVRDLPATKLEEYAELSRPRLDGIETLADETRTIDGRKAIVRTYRGKRQGVELMFQVTVVEDGPRRLQVAAWTTAEAWEQGAKDELPRIGDSLRFLDAGAAGESSGR